MSSFIAPKSVKLATFIVFLAYLVGPTLNHALTVFGVWRRPSRTLLANEKTDLIVIEDTVNCEDLHYHEPSRLLFTACEDTIETRFKWFPPMANFDDPTLLEKNRASLHVIDPVTFKSTRLAFRGFPGPFSSHGIDVASDPDRPEGEAVYIYAVNHLPNPDFLWNGTVAEQAKTAAGAAVHKGRSRVEVFHHVIGSQVATHIRSIQHPLIRTPNDIYAVNSHSIYVSNDHYYRDGLLRHIEDAVAAARWTDIVHVHFTESLTVPATHRAAAADHSYGIAVSVVLDKVHNLNGLGHGRTPDELLAASCSSGVLHTYKLLPQSPLLPPLLSAGSRFTVAPDAALQEPDPPIRVDSVIDNPSYFADPFAVPGSPQDRSGYVLPGLPDAVNIGHATKDPAATSGVMVWLARRKRPATQHGNATATAATAATARAEAPQVKLLFQDDGSRIRTASAAYLVAIDPALEGGKRKGWLYVTGFQAVNAIAVKVDL